MCVCKYRYVHQTKILTSKMYVAYNQLTLIPPMFSNSRDYDGPFLNMFDQHDTEATLYTAGILCYGKHPWSTHGRQDTTLV